MTFAIEDNVLERPQGTRANSPVRVSRLGYLSFDTPDLDRFVEHYTKILGFVATEQTSKQAFLTTGADHHCLVINKSDSARGRQVVGYEIKEDLSSAQRRLSAAGLKSERRSDIGPGTPDVLVLTEPGTGSMIHLYQEQEKCGLKPSLDHRPTKLGHAGAYTSDLALTRSFYEKALGFRWSDSIGDFFVFMGCNADHHAGVFMQSDSMRGVHHTAYEARDLNHLQTMIDNLVRNGLKLYWGPGRHAVGHNVFAYHDDPDGNHVEVFTQLDVMLDEEKGYYEPRPWHEHAPMVPKVWEPTPAAMNMWGPVPPGGPIKR